jgi:hypothetical protein
MTDETTRKPSGRFAKSSSGNPRGRPKGRRRKLESSSDFRQAIINIANRPVGVRSNNGSVESITLFESQCLNLVNENGKNRLGSKNFVELAQDAAAREEQLSRRRRPPEDE